MEPIFVGRKRELAELEATLEDALAGRARFVMLVGEPGIGKTTTAAQLTDRAERRGARVLVGRCHEDEGAPPFWLWLQVLRAAIEAIAPADLRAQLGAGAADVAQIVPELRERFPDVPAASSGDPDAARFRLFDSVTTFLKRSSRARPVVVLLDDLHWADKPSLLLLRFLAREMGEAQLLVIATYRDIEVQKGHPLADVLPDLTRGGAQRRIQLGGLREEETRTLVGALATRAVPETFARAILEETEGNPFFVQEIVRHLVEERVLERGEAADWEAVRRTALSESVREVVSRRLGRLGDPCRRALAVASVLGREFELRELATVSGMPADELQDALGEAVAARVVASIGRFRYGFSHALIRETLYGSLGTRERFRLHREIGEMLERESQGRRDVPASQLAHHFFEVARGGGDAARATDWATRSGDQALASLAYEEAARHFERALSAHQLAHIEEDPRSCAIRLRIGDAQWKSGDIVAAKATFRAAATTARSLALSEELARAALGFGGLLIAPGVVDTVLVELLEESLAALGEGDRPLAARVLARLAMEFYYSPEREKRVRLSGEAVAMAERLGDAPTMAATLSARRYAIWSPENLTERLATTAEIVRRAELGRDREAALLGYHWGVVDLLEAGDIEAADREMERYARLATELRQPFHIWYGAVFRAMRTLLAGRLEESGEQAKQALALGQRAQPPVAFHLLNVQSFQLRWLQGRLEEFRDTVQDFATRFPTLPVWRCALAHLHTETGSEPAARAEIERLAASDFAVLPRDGNWLIAMFHLTEACAWLDDAKRAAILYDQLAPFASHVVVSGRAVACWGSVAYLLGVLATTLGRWDAADRHLKAALEQNASLRAKPLVAQTELRYAILLLKRGRGAAGDHGDRASALAFLGSALKTARELGMRRLLERATVLESEARRLPAEAEADVSRLAEGAVTVLFSDMEGFSAMTERLGDRAAHSVIQAHNAIVRAELEAHGGSELELLGDGFLLSFASATSALRCAVAMQKAFARYSGDHSDEPIRVRIGLHTGEPLQEGEKLFGKTLILASRIASQAQGGEIFVSRMVRELTAATGDFAFDDGWDATLKGLSGSYRLHEVLWDGRAPKQRGTTTASA